MKRSRTSTMAAVVAICLALSLGLAGCAGKAGAPETVNCPARISWQVAPEAKLTQFDCAPGTHGGQQSLIFTVGVMNVTDKPMRYRVNVFLEDMDKAAGHLVPRTGKPPVLAPGKSESVKIPFIGTTEAPKKVLVVVKPISLD